MKLINTIYLRLMKLIFVFKIKQNIIRYYYVTK